MCLVVVGVHSIVHVAQIQNRGKDLPDLVDLFFCEAKIAHARHGLSVVHLIVHTFDSVSASWTAKEAIVRGISRSQLVLGAYLWGGEALVEDVEGALVVTERDRARLLQQVGQDLGRLDRSSLCLHAHLDEFAESGGVDVASRLCVTEGLHQGVRVEDVRLYALPSAVS